MNRSPLWMIFTLLMAFFLLVMAVMLSFSNYRYSTKNAIQNEENSTNELITLKLKNLDSYLTELSDFCVLPVYDSTFYQQLLTTEELSDNELSSLLEDSNLNYYSRTDLNAYRIDLINHSLSIVKNAGQQHMKVIYDTDVQNSEEYGECIASGSNYAIFPAESKSSLMKFCHTIIRINDKKPVALVTIEVNKSIMAGDLKGKILALYNKNGELLYTNASGGMKDELTRYKSGVTDSVNIGSEDYFVVTQQSSSSGLVLTAYTPRDTITDKLSEIRLFSILQGAGFLFIALLITFLLIRYLTAPLSALADFQTQMASGKFPRINIGRCRETAELSASFNDMSEHIDRLVNDNLVSSINEKNARIEALEAQVNPHFLYNTLQAIGSEALMNDQTQIYTMLTKLANNMRYSINGSNAVTLEKEMEFTDNYIDLQKLRLEERLKVVRSIDPALQGAMVPKCSIQMIVENSIKYGISGDITSLELEIEAFRKDAALVIRVRDNGAGMSRERIEEIMERIHSYPASAASNGAGREDPLSTGIGLANLYGRLWIMYDGHADIRIESSCGEDHYTCTTLILEDKDAQSIDRR